MFRLDRLKEYEISSPVNSASLHPDQQVFVCGGEDFKMYKCDFGTGAELGNELFYSELKTYFFGKSFPPPVLP